MLRTRYFRILWYFTGVLLNIGWWDILRPRLGRRERSNQTRPARLRQMSSRFRSLAVQMGGVLIKVGQFLSTRLDVLPREITDELSGLQDEVNPESFVDVRKMIESEFQTSLEERFFEFQETPMASASIGQVHYARLRSVKPVSEISGDTPIVVVKVQRSNIERIVETDLSALRVVGRWLNAYPPIRRRANVPSLLSEFSRSLYEEIDYLREGRNAETFDKNFKDQSEIKVPKVYWEFTTRRVLTLENVLAIKITDYEAIEAAGIDRGEIANRLFDTYLKQIFEDRFFHADPHPGNLFVLPLRPAIPGEKTPWRLVFVDFGMTGTISASLLQSLRELFIAVGTQDAPRIIKAYQIMGILLPGADVELLEKAGTRVFERFWGKSTSEMMRMGHSEANEFIQEFGELLYDLPFQIPENMILLGRTLAILSGICTGLDPAFNLWTSVAPYAEQLLSGESGLNWQFLLKELSSTLLAAFNLPKKADSLINLIEQGRLEVRSTQILDALRRMDKSMDRLSRAVFFAAFFFGGVQLYLAGQHPLAIGSAVLAVLILLFSSR
jgi:predicted unusual protein kinase regulating ubiquinone biosynthesis (AarF/ABC1/UbiB family)